ncbi:21213_t:CDS:2, partial [Cetraspora pellucida]
MSRGESVALAIVIVKSSYIKELIFDMDLVEMLKSIDAKIIYKG